MSITCQEFRDVFHNIQPRLMHPMDVVTMKQHFEECLYCQEYVAEDHVTHILEDNDASFQSEQSGQQDS